VVKSAFTLIELIFAIVVIGIAALSLPMMTQATQKGIESNIVQEAIFAGAAELNQAISFQWDINSIEVNSTNLLAKVINISGDCNATTKLRPGHVSQPLHRRCIDATTITTASTASDVNRSNLHNAAHGSINLFTDTTKDQAGYKKAYNSTLVVGLNPTFAGTAQAGMKSLTVTVTDALTGDTITQLATYSANIGEVDYYKRAY
jgi:prepilin-type N-terminal cleavage/methylation domain-containing protein